MSAGWLDVAYTSTSLHCHKELGVLLQASQFGNGSISPWCLHRSNNHTDYPMCSADTILTLSTQSALDDVHFWMIYQLGNIPKGLLQWEGRKRAPCFACKDRKCSTLFCRFEHVCSRCMGDTRSCWTGREAWLETGRGHHRQPESPSSMETRGNKSFVCVMRHYLIVTLHYLIVTLHYLIVTLYYLIVSSTITWSPEMVYAITSDVSYTWRTPV